MSPDLSIAARERWAIALVCAALVVAAFAPAFGNGFVEVFDDAIYITANGNVRQGLTWDTVRWALLPGSSDQTYWHPLTWLSLAADVQLFGVRPGPIHAENVALHLAAALLLFAALERMTGSRWKSAAVALLFAVHPLQVESVAWAVERKTVLSGALGMGALLAYVRWTEKRGWSSYAAALALFAASLLAKPQLVTLPFVLVLLDVWPLGRSPWAAPERPDASTASLSFSRLAAEKLPFLGVALAVVAIVVSSRADVGAAGVALPLRIGNALTSYWWYLAKLVWPAGLAYVYPQQAVSAWRAVAAAVGLAAAFAALLVARRRLSLGPAIGCLWFLGALLPASGLVRSGLWPGTADRFVYFPMIGVLVSVVWAAGGLVGPTRRAQRAAVTLLGAATLVLAARTHAQARVWRDQVTLFAHAVEVTEPNHIAWSNLGHALQASGRVAEARSLYERMIRILPEPDGPLNLGVLLHEQGDLEGASRAYAVALERDPRCGLAFFNSALIRKRTGDWRGALENFERALAAGFRQANVFDQLGQAYEALGRGVDAERAFREALRLDPFSWRAEARLGRLLAMAGRAEDAARAFASARQHASSMGDDPRAVDEIAQLHGAGARQLEP